MSAAILFRNGVYLAALLGAASAPAAELPEMVAVPGLGFSIARTEVTVGQWAACVEAMACPPRKPRWADPGMPMTDVTAADAESFTFWLGEVTGRHYRLPSEDEWEAAARAGTVTPWPWGEAMAPGRAVCHLCDPHHAGGPAPAGSMAPNPLGLLDMHGNVWEWTADCWSGDCRVRVVKGGAWTVAAFQTRSGASAPRDARARGYDVGFRVVVSD
ncbi:MAG: SUMF1/EgtB/PvdO family nonheme iron enzyme [Pseudomonadota bacterium]